MTHTARINLFQLAPGALKALVNLSMTMKKGQLGPRLVELIQLRVSQINGCGFCIDMHWRDLLKQDVDPRHLNALPAWREAPWFSARERAALQWAEALNAIPHKDPSDADFAELKANFSDDEIAEIGYTVGAIRSWNMLNVSSRNPIPEHPAPGM